MKIVLFVLLAVISMVVLFLFLKPGALQEKPTNLTIDLEIKQNALTSKNTVFRVVQGEKITLRILSDADEELHVHGYDITIPLKKNGRTSATFVADATGGFPLELHGSGRDIASLEVIPK